MSLRTFSGLAFICALAACSPSQSDALNRPSNGAGSGGSSSATGGATSGGGSSFGGTGFGGSFIDVGGQSTGNGGNAGQCASSVYEPEEIIVQVPVEVVT